MERDPEEPEPVEPFHIRDRIEHEGQVLQGRGQRSRTGPSRPIFRIRGSIIRSNQTALAEVEAEKDEVGAVAASSNGDLNEKVPDSPGTSAKKEQENEKPVTSSSETEVTAVNRDGNGAKKTA